ncbi:peptide receptor GPCR [Biomphalaria glabrata]|nr:putative G-protein coupled receptor frpr-1 [Biomphalaria glabrata]KAI8799086.1 G-protein coupled receptor frpr-1 [Biomphalaria glabrata]
MSSASLYSTEDVGVNYSMTSKLPKTVTVEDFLVQISFYVKFGVLLPLSLLGLVTNVLNLVVFFSRGFKEGPTISMTVISFWNLFKCVCGIVARMSYPIGLLDKALGVTWENVTLPYMEYSTIFASYVTFALAAFVSIERFICVWKPLAAKSVLTPTVDLLSVLLISALTYGAYCVMYFIYAIRFEYSQTFNTIVAKVIFSDLYYQHSGVVMVYYQSVAIALPLISFIILCIFSLGTVIFLKKSSEFLQKDFSNSSYILKVSRREKQVSKTLLSIILIYIINLFPRFVFYIVQLVEPEFYLLRKYNNLFKAIALCIFILDYFNSSIHFFVYLRVSSSFREYFM